MDLHSRNMYTNVETYKKSLLGIDRMTNSHTWIIVHWMTSYHIKQLAVSDYNESGKTSMRMILWHGNYEKMRNIRTDWLV